MEEGENNEIFASVRVSRGLGIPVLSSNNVCKYTCYEATNEICPVATFMPDVYLVLLQLSDS